MDKIASYESLLSVHPLWRRDFVKESSYANTVAAMGVGALGGAGLGYAAKRKGSRRDKVRAAAHGALLGGTVGYTGGELHRISKAHQGKMRALGAAHDVEMNNIRARRVANDRQHAQDMAAIRRRTQKLRETKSDLDRLFANGKISLEDLDRFMAG